MGPNECLLCLCYSCLCGIESARAMRITEQLVINGEFTKISIETAFIHFYKHHNNLGMQRIVRAGHCNSPQCFLLSYLSVCDLLHSIFKYVAKQGKFVIKSKRDPLFGPVNVYELLKAPGGRGLNPWNFSFHGSLKLL